MGFLRFVSSRSVALSGLLMAGVLLYGCGGEGSAPPPVSSAPPSPTPTPPPAATPAPAPTTVSVETSFTNITAQSGLTLLSQPEGLFSNGEIPIIFPHGVAAGDYDNDGDIDLFVAKADRSANHLYRNMGGMAFEDVALSAGVAFTSSANESYRHGSPAFVDINSDGFLDLFIPGLEDDPTMIFVSNQDGTFSDITAGSGFETMRALHSHSPAFGDYDLDGDLDLFLGHWGTPRDFDNVGETEHLWRNDSDSSGLRFTSVTLNAGIAPSILTNLDPLITQRGFDNIFTPTFTFVNDDMWPDIVVTGDFGFSQVFINQRDGTFENQTDFGVIIDGNGMGSAIGDYDNDGDMDWFVSSILAREVAVMRPVPSNLSEIGNRLYRNNSGVFEDVTDDAGVADGAWGWGSCFIDFENDGDLDIYHTNGFEEPNFGGFLDDPSRAFIAGDDGRFSEQAEALGLNDVEQGRGIVCDDFDNDGDVDILQLHRNANNAISLWRNDYEGPNSFLKVVLQGVGGNRKAVGARISVTIDGVTYVRVVALGSNFASHNSTIQHFGLGETQSTASIRVEWPGGQQSNLTAVAVDQTIMISQ